MVEPRSDDGPFSEPKLALALAIVVAAMIVGGVVAITLGRMSWTEALEEHERAREELQSTRPVVPGSEGPLELHPESDSEALE